MFSNRLDDATRHARRMARIARWDRPLTGRLDRLRAWANMLLVDHGVFRVMYLNRHAVTPSFWRAAQPAPHQVRAAAAAGVKTIVNLRGGREFGSWPLEKEAADAAGVALRDLVVRSREAPSRETVKEALDLFRTAETPVLVHCKSGADRAGFVAALYLLAHEKRPFADAMRQLSPRYGHFRWSRTGVLDAFFEAYRREGLEKGVDFETWLDTIYDPAAVTRDFRANALGNLLVDRILRRE